MFSLYIISIDKYCYGILDRQRQYNPLGPIGLAPGHPRHSTPFSSPAPNIWPVNEEAQVAASTSRLSTHPYHQQSAVINANMASSGGMFSENPTRDSYFNSSQYYISTHPYLNNPTMSRASLNISRMRNSFDQRNYGKLAYLKFDMHLGIKYMIRCFIRRFIFDTCFCII